MTIPTNATIVYVRTEATPGTGETIDQSMLALRAMEAAITPDGTKVVERKNLTSAFPGVVGHTRAGTMARIKIVTELYVVDSLGSPTVASPLLPLWKACGVQTSPASTTVWAPPLACVPAAAEGSDYCPCTVEIHEVGGNRYRATGCVGTFTIEAEAGSPVKVTWELTGSWVVPATTAFTAAAALYSTLQLPEIFWKATLTDGYATGTVVGIESFSFSPGTVVTPRLKADASTENCYGIPAITRDEPAILTLVTDAESETTTTAWANSYTTPVTAAWSLAWDDVHTWTIALTAGVPRMPELVRSKPFRQWKIEVVGNVKASDGTTCTITEAA